jgi:hypothetical protein
VRDSEFSNEIDCRYVDRERDRLREMLMEIEHIRNIVDIAARQQLDKQLIDKPKGDQGRNKTYESCNNEMNRRANRRPAFIQPAQVFLDEGKHSRTLNEFENKINLSSRDDTAKMLKKSLSDTPPDYTDLIARFAQLFLFADGFPILRRTKPAPPRRFGAPTG